MLHPGRRGLVGPLEDDDEHRAPESARCGSRVQELVEHSRPAQDRAEGRPAEGPPWLPRVAVAVAVAVAGVIVGVLSAASSANAALLREHRVERVVEARDGRPQTRLEERAHGLPAGLRRRERPRAEGPRGGRSVEPQSRAGDDAEGALAPDDEGHEIGSRRPPSQRDDLPLAGHALERRDHVLDLPVRPRALARAARRDPAADRAAEDGRREVPEREARALERLLEGNAHVARVDVDERRVGLDRVDAGEALEVDHHDVLARRDPGADAAARAEGDDGDAAVARPPDDVRDVLGGGGPHDGGGAMLRGAARADVHVVARPEIARIGDPVRVVRAGPQARDRPRELGCEVGHAHSPW
jgi:hypothetical protein